MAFMPANRERGRERKREGEREQKYKWIISIENKCALTVSKTVSKFLFSCAKRLMYS